MNKDIEVFARKVRNYTVSEDYMTISGSYEKEPLKYDLFKVKGAIAKLLRKQLVKLEETN